MQEKPKRNYTKQDIKLFHIKEWRRGGLSKTAYASKAGISASSLSKWVLSENKSKHKFKPLSVINPVAIKQNTLIEISIDQRIKLRVSNDVDPMMIANIVRGLLQCS